MFFTELGEKNNGLIVKQDMFHVKQRIHNYLI